MKKYELEPMHTSQKSFYGKAYVYEHEMTGWRYYRLISYQTPVLNVKVRDGVTYISRRWNSYSATTLRHVNEFLKQLCFPALTAKQWRALHVGAYYAEDEVLLMPV